VAALLVLRSCEHAYSHLLPSIFLLPQRPILLSGHERSLNQIKYNREGDLLFSVSKDNVVCAWFSHNGERLGTYEGHNGTVWSVDVDGESWLKDTSALSEAKKQR
jgi:translation initiation factor 3 subunit I